MRRAYSRGGAPKSLAARKIWPIASGGSAPSRVRCHQHPIWATFSSTVIRRNKSLTRSSILKVGSRNRALAMLSVDAVIGRIWPHDPRDDHLDLSRLSFRNPPKLGLT